MIKSEMDKRIIMKFLILTLLAIQLYAIEITKVVGISEAWKGATEKNCKGLYWEVATAVFELNNIKLECKLAPYARGVKLVEKEKVDFWVGSYKDEETFPYYPEIAIDADNVSILYDTTKQKFSKIEDIKNKKVAWIRDYDYQEYIDIPMKIREIKDKKSGIKMVLLGRVDFLMDDKIELVNALKNIKLKKKDLKIKTFMELKTYMAFAKNKRGKELVKLWDKNMKILNKSGKLEEIYNRYSDSEFYPFEVKK